MSTREVDDRRAEDLEGPDERASPLFGGVEREERCIGMVITTAAGECAWWEREWIGRAADSIERCDRVIGKPDRHFWAG